MNVARLAMLARVGALAATVLGLVGCAARAPAHPSVAVLEVRGADPDEQRAWHERVAGLARARQLEVIDADGYWLMARRLGAQALTAPNVARVARAIGATAVVHGRLDRPRRRGKDRRRARRVREVVTIYVRDGESGRVVEKHRVRVGRGRAARRSEAALDRTLLARVEVPAASGAEAGPARDADEKPAAKKPSTKPVKPAKLVVAKKPAAKKPVAKKPAAKAVAKKPAAKAVAKEPAAKAVAKNPAAKKPAVTASAGSAEPDAPPVLYDEEGQAIDEERPPPPPR